MRGAGNMAFNVHRCTLVMGEEKRVFILFLKLKENLIMLESKCFLDNFDDNNKKYFAFVRSATFASMHYERSLTDLRSEYIFNL